MKFRGVNELVAHLNEIENSVPKLKKVVKTNTALLQNMAQRGAPVDTGYMKSKITQSIQDNGMAGNVASEAPYSVNLEFGTFKQAAQPFMRPALNHVTPKFKSEANEIFKR